MTGLDELVDGCQRCINLLHQPLTLLQAFLRGAKGLHLMDLRLTLARKGSTGSALTFLTRDLTGEHPGGRMRERQEDQQKPHVHYSSRAACRRAMICST